MDFHLEQEIRLNTSSKHKSLYDWAIDELNADGTTACYDQIPWQWTLYFTATSCELSDSLDIDQTLKFKFKVTTDDGKSSERETGGTQTIDHRQSIRIQLRSGANRWDDKEYFRRTKFSMFGTGRTIKHFQLEIVPLADPAEKERCTAWGCPSYTTEIDFRNETSDDCLVFYLAVKPETFADYVARIAQGQVDGIVFSAGQVDGFYSGWSPSISTDRVKVLTADSAHKLTVPPDCKIEPPRLGEVGQAHLLINRRIVFQTPDADEPEADAVERSLRAVPEARTVAASAAADPRVLQTLQSLKRAAWVVIWLLALILAVIVMRR